MQQPIVPPRRGMHGCGVLTIAGVFCLFLITFAGMFSSWQDQRSGKTDRDRYLAKASRDNFERTLRNMDPNTALFLAVHDGGSNYSARLVVSNSWFLQARPIKLQTAQNLQRAWQQAYDASGTDKAWLTIVDVNGNQLAHGAGGDMGVQD